MQSLPQFESFVAMAAASPILCTSIRVTFLAGFDKRTFSASPSFQFKLRSNGTRNQSRSGGCSIIRCEEKNNRVAVEGGDGWIAENDGLVRSLPLVLGAGALVAILLNRSLAGIAPVADSSSAQSRSDVLALALAATVLLQGLVWKSIQPRPVLSVEMDGVDCFNMVPSLSSDAAWELKWVWDSLRNATRTKALVILYDGACVLQAGLAATAVGGNVVPVNASEFMTGELYKGVEKSGRQTYLANLALYPGRFELLRFLPRNTQAVLLQPLGDDGVLVLASDAIRGFTPADQAWIGTIAEKVDTTLQDWVASSTAKMEGDGVTIEPRHAMQASHYGLCCVKGGMSYPVGFSSLVCVRIMSTMLQLFSECNSDSESS